jgi:hypothetical protein
MVVAQESRCLLIRLVGEFKFTGKRDNKPEKATLPISPLKLDTTAHASPSFAVHSSSRMDGGVGGCAPTG